MAAIHLAAVLFGLTGIFGELIDADAMLITAGRAAFAVVALYAVIRAQGLTLRHGINPRTLGYLAVASAMLATHWVTFFIAVKTSGVAIATLGFATFPAFITLSEWLVFKEKISRSEWYILVMVTLGLVLVTPSFDFENEATIGLAWAVLSGFTFAVFALINRRAVSHIPAQQVALWENLFVLMLTLPFCLDGIGGVSAASWMWIAMLGVFCTALSHYLMVVSLQVIEARSAGIVIALEPIYAIAFAAILFAQYPSARALLGGALMIAAIVWSGLRKPSRKNAAQAH